MTNTERTQWYGESMMNYAREYRLHMTQEKCFMSWRKLRRADAEQRYFFNSTNCNWVGEDHELFDRPTNWDTVVEDCKKAMRATGLDIGCFDVRIQSSSKAEPKYILVECNSAPALGEAGLEAYRTNIKEIIEKKINLLNEQ